MTKSPFSEALENHSWLNAEYDPDAWAGVPMLLAALRGGDPLYQTTRHGDLVSRPSEVRKKIEALGCRFVREQRDADSEVGLWNFASEDTFVILNPSTTKDEPGCSVAMQIHTTNRELFGRFCELVSAEVTLRKQSTGYVYAMIKGSGGCQISRVGQAWLPLERGNYTPGVIEKVDLVRADFASPTPSGRVVILSGPPGTGKSSLCRSLLDVPRCTFVLVPAAMVASLDGPELLSVLTKNKDENHAMVLLIEDGDAILVPRGSDNMQSISSLLNLSDGMIGAMLDLRVLVTTNAKKVEIDEAILRPGRLSAHIEVGYLSPAEATGVLQRLAPGAPALTRRASLAEVYAEARRRGWSPDPATSASVVASPSHGSRRARRLGFGGGDD